MRMRMYFFPEFCLLLHLRDGGRGGWIRADFGQVCTCAEWMSLFRRGMGAKAGEVLHVGEQVWAYRVRVCRRFVGGK